ncbi:hypothetical protein [Corynebacterium suicordis]|uniref:Uncharacterized protein n=1 Tax=Corynebacterium suicordis DSM 45110 TaxID=1121369 RepID=A0ABR9ZKU5_9CORY|nr:hypothetical protein [Corynebacterium suicordis]MBF4554060.1 hypothetical protein [Corynebacterium suicordis DSM 45110]MDR6276961.1 hypothetical protein [Corynebacterium suicordis]
MIEAPSSHFRSRSAASIRWQKNQEKTEKMIPNWRTPQRQQLLINIFIGSLGLGFFTAFAFLFYVPALFLWLPFTVIMCVSWTMLRITIGSRDTAPLDVLDEYESAVLDHWRRRAYVGVSWSLLAMGGLLVFIGVSLGLGETSSEFLGKNTSSWMYFLGLISLLLYITFSSLPAIGYARNFPASYPENN